MSPASMVLVAVLAANGMMTEALMWCCVALCLWVDP